MIDGPIRGPFLSRVGGGGGVVVVVVVVGDDHLRGVSVLRQNHKDEERGGEKIDHVCETHTLGRLFCFIVLIFFLLVITLGFFPFLSFFVLVFG